MDKYHYLPACFVGFFWKVFTRDSSVITSVKVRGVLVLLRSGPEVVIDPEDYW